MVKVFAYFRVSPFSIATSRTWVGQTYSQTRQPRQFPSPVFLSSVRARMPRKRSGYGRGSSGYICVTGRRPRFLSVTPMARHTARVSWPSSLQKPGPAPLWATGAPDGDDERRGEQDQHGRGEQELP